METGLRIESVLLPVCAAGTGFIPFAEGRVNLMQSRPSGTDCGSEGARRKSISQLTNLCIEIGAVQNGQRFGPGVAIAD